VARIEALAGFLAHEDGADLLAAYKRAGNILKAEARKQPLPGGEPMRPAEPAEEAALFDALRESRPELETALAAEDYTAALEALASLRRPLDAFFDGVLVNSAVATERDNRLRLLGQVRETMGRAADFSRVSG
jgi:glycyl-tRNA synthetase beta chain